MADKAKGKSQNSEIETCENEFLNPELAGKFRIKDTHCRHLLNTSLGDIDFRTITEAQAEQLVADGVPFIEKVFS